MAEIYPVLYAFENSMREWIDGHLTAAYGSKWHEGTARGSKRCISEPGCVSSEAT